MAHSTDLAARLAGARDIDVEVYANSGQASGDILDRIEQRRLLTELYTRLDDQEKIDKIDQLLDHFSRRYDQMWEILQKKYNKEASSVLRAHAEGIAKKQKAKANARKKAKAKAEAKAKAKLTEKKESKKKGIKIVTTSPSLDFRKNIGRKKKRNKKNSELFPWDEGSRSSGKMSPKEQQEEMEQELLDFYSVVAPGLTDTIEKVVMDYFDRRSELEDILMRRYLRRSVFLWSQNEGGLDRIVDLELLSEITAGQLEATKQYELLKAVNSFYEVVRPGFKGDHAKETVKRWQLYPNELVDRLVRRYLPSSAFRWMKRGQRRTEDKIEEARLKDQLIGEATNLVDDFLEEGKAEKRAKMWQQHENN